METEDNNETDSIVANNRKLLKSNTDIDTGFESTLIKLCVTKPPAPTTVITYKK